MMACGLSKSLGLSSSLKKHQGIVTILGGDISSNTLSAPSLKRTFSADFSSKNWLLQNGSSSSSSPIKRVSSSEKLRAFGNDSSSSNDEEATRSGFDIWAQIQEDKKKKKEIEPDQTDGWSSILSEKKKTESSDGAAAPPLYVHPLVKRESSLSEKSLEICTESLGSETGCEGFSSYSSSDNGDSEIEKVETNLVITVTETKEKEEEEEETEAEVKKESIAVPCIDMPKGSFPPPIRSLSSQSGSSLRMKTRRDNGRLVLEAVSMPSQNNFSVKRQNGRLLLTFADINTDLDDKEEEEETQDKFAFKLTQTPIGPITVHRLAHKPISIPMRNSKWPGTEEFETKPDLSTPVVHSLPPRPRAAQLARSTKPPSTVDDTVGAACFNTFDYFWKPTNIETLGPNTKTQFQAHKIVNGHEGWINGCKERRRSLLSVESFCIATS
ncbi:unnamed protein product [Cochlearia groenlandica]